MEHQNFTITLFLAISQILFKREIWAETSISADLPIQTENRVLQVTNSAEFQKLKSRNLLRQL